MKHELNIDAPEWAPSTSHQGAESTRTNIAPATDRHDGHVKRVVVGVYFGTFDPPHENHFRLARSAIDALGLAAVFMVPNVDPPFKKSSALAHRLALLSAHPLAKQGLVQAFAPPDGVRTDWPGRLRVCELVAADAARERGIADASVAMLVGQDSFESSIRRADQDVLTGFRVPVYVFPRLGYDTPSIPDWLNKGPFALVTSYRETRQISSTSLRAAFAAGSDVHPDDLHAEVAAYCKEHRLYAHAPVTVLTGGPGTGKSTIAGALCRSRKLTHLNPGDLYRAALADERFQRTVQQLVETDRALWSERLRLFLEAAEQQAMAISQNCAFATERKRPSEIRASCERLRQHCALVVHLKASEECMLERVRTRGRGGDDASRVRTYVEKEANRCELELAELAESGVPVLHVDTDKPVESILAEVERALQALKGGGPVGNVAEPIPPDAGTVIRQVWETMPPAQLQAWETLPPAHLPDRAIICRDCKQAFAFPHREQQSYETKRWADPIRCPACRRPKAASNPSGTRSTGARSCYGPGPPQRGYDDRGPPPRDDRGPAAAGGWREREAARGGGQPAEEAPVDDDGFTVVPRRGGRR